MGNIYDEIKDISMPEYSDEELAEIEDEVNFMTQTDTLTMNEEELFEAWIEFKIEGKQLYTGG